MLFFNAYLYLLCPIAGFVLTCETIKSSTPDALRGWSVADLNTLTKTEFENCQSELGAGNFSASQFEALAVMAETVSLLTRSHYVCMHFLMAVESVKV